MTSNSSLSKETEQFSFIRTIKIESHQKSDRLLLSSADRQINSSSILGTRTNTTNNSALSINHEVNSPITISNSWYSWDTFNHGNSHLTTVIVVPESEVKKQLNKPSFNYYLDRILLIAAGGYFCFICWWLFLAKNAMFPLTFLSRQEETISQADAEFINYMEQSLEVMERQVTDKKSSSANQTAEVVYVPVYTPSSDTSTNNSPQKNNPSFPQAQSNNLPLLPPPPPLNQLAAMNPPLSAIPIKPTTPPLESVKTKTTPVNTTPQTVATPEIVATTNVTPNLDRVLVGVMELNESSAALFKINGVTQRIWLGDKINNTDWVLESVANQKVIVSREGKSLTLNVGESF
jgi:hypothetical protein